MGYLIHKKSDVQSHIIGDETRIWQYTVVLSGAVIGNNCNINCHCFIEDDVIIGNNVTVKSGVQLWNGLRIQDDVFIGPNVTFTNDRTPRSKKFPEKFDKTVIKKGASIGAGAVIIGGITVGEYSMIGAGAVVTHDIVPNGLYYGNPAELKGYVCQCGEKMNPGMECVNCGKTFNISD
ncbi:MAG: acyltransferase [bacterium]